MNGVCVLGVGDFFGGYYWYLLYCVNDQWDDGEGFEGGIWQCVVFVKVGGDNNICFGLFCVVVVFWCWVDVMIDNGDFGGFQFVEQCWF